jgi:hypothetical protein
MMLGTNRPHRHGRQGGTRPCGIDVHQEAQGGLPDGGRRRGLPRLEGDQGAKVVAFEDLGMEAIYEFDRAATCR